MGSSTSSTDRSTISETRWSSDSARHMADRIHNEVKQMVATSRLRRKHTNQIALVTRSDLNIGRILGKGAFSQVHEVTVRGDASQKRYAMKHLKRTLMSQPDNFRLAAAELAVEAHMLASFDHPNILKIRGWAANGVASFVEGCHDSFFLLLDCLEETLDQRITRWKEDEEFLEMKQLQEFTASPYLLDVWRRLSNTNEINAPNHTLTAQHHQIYQEKYQVCSEIASALSYLHETCGIVFRDLKPNNIGFSRDGRVQLFDFGLSRELPGNACLTTPFKMSGKVGTLRYMAVEVAAHLPYNISADVYSWAMVCYEIWTTTKPFQGWTREMHSDYTCALGMRPEMTEAVPLQMQTLIQVCWDQNPEIRPRMSAVYNQVRLFYEQEAHQLAMCLQQQHQCLQQQQQEQCFQQQQQALLQQALVQQQQLGDFTSPFPYHEQQQQQQQHDSLWYPQQHGLGRAVQVELPANFRAQPNNPYNPKSAAFNQQDIYTAGTTSMSLSNDYSMHDFYSTL